MQQVFQMLELVAPMNSTVLIHGETGTGKELIARTIHHNSPRRGSAVRRVQRRRHSREPLAEAELFGHAKGAFTGAVSARVGRFELAAPRHAVHRRSRARCRCRCRRKLLRALQEREIERVGESRPIKFDARVIAATNSDLRKLVEGRHVPRRPLLPPQRDSDHAAAAARSPRGHSAAGAALRAEVVPAATTCRRARISQDAMRVLMNYSWPGNIRQLENAIEHSVAMTGQEREIQPAALPDDIIQPASSLLLPSVAIPDEGINFTSVVSQLERELILRCLEKTGGNKRQAARLLQLSRTTLIDKLHRLESWPTSSRPRSLRTAHRARSNGGRLMARLAPLTQADFARRTSRPSQPPRSTPSSVHQRLRDRQSEAGRACRSSVE